MSAESKDTGVHPADYNLIWRGVHWVTALLIGGLLTAGFFMADMPFSPLKLEIYGLHKSFGLLVLFLAAFRVVWWFLTPRPAHLSSHKPWERVLAKITHFTLYGLLIAMPLSGWVMSSAGDFPVPFFALFDMPDLTSKNEDLAEAVGEAHEVMAFIILALVALHAAGALKHHWIDRDETLARMTSRRGKFLFFACVTALAGLIIAAPLAALIFADEDAAENSGKEDVRVDTGRGGESGAWVIDLPASSIAFTATQYGSAFTGRFAGFEGKIDFDPQALDKSDVDIKIDIASIETGSADRDAQAKGREWFDVESFPGARFKSDSFRKIAGDNYEVAGILEIRNIKMPLTFPFTIAIERDVQGVRHARVVADFRLNRLDFGVGSGQWAQDDAIGRDVSIHVLLKANSSSP